uniref:Uncharacterized protein n=1 Tax=Ananas comosus var. bracteatus TaxID=296719 RepID=A0A6V7NY32_ANACO|nr:unnamed protein product [Ananas comosus var. bracteatus]
MASGRHGGLRDHEFRGLELDKEASRRKELYLDRIHDREGDRRRGRDSGVRGRDTQGDFKKRDSLNGYRGHHHQQQEKQQHTTENGNYSGGGARNDQKRNRVSGRSVDREAGELSSGSGSDVPEAPQPQTEDNGFRDRENGCLLPSPSKKRKFSPIVWDRDDGKQSTTFNKGNIKESVEPAELPLPPPLPSGHFSPNLIDLPHDRELGGYQEAEQMEEDDCEYPVARNISSSRWADGNDALDDEKNEEGEAVPQKKRSTSPADSLDKSSLKKVPSPELGEIVREDSAGTASRSSGSGRDDYMDVDRDEPDSYVSERMTETESEDEDYGAKTLNLYNRPKDVLTCCKGAGVLMSLRGSTR